MIEDNRQLIDTKGLWEVPGVNSGGAAAGVRASPSSSRRATFAQEKRAGLPPLPQDRGHGDSSTSGAASSILKLATSPTPLNPELEEHRRPVNEMGVRPGAGLYGRRAPAFYLDQITSLS